MMIWSTEKIFAERNFRRFRKFAQFSSTAKFISGLYMRKENRSVCENKSLRNTDVLKNDY